MGTRWILGDLRTGRRILDLPVLKGSWDDRLLAAETINVTVDMNDPDVQALDLQNSATICKTFLGVVENGIIMAAGPIWASTYDDDSRTLQLNAKGLASYFDHRLILPLLAATISVDQWTVPDPSDNSKTMANPLLATTFTSLSRGTMAKKLVQQAETHTGGDLPIVYQADEAATFTDTIEGVEFKSIGSWLAQNAKRENGVEYNFAPRFSADGLGVEWVLQTGTLTQPLVTSSASLTWDMTSPETPAYGLTITDDGSEVGSLAWQTGGRRADDVLVARSFDPVLTDAGYPLLELFDSSHTSVVLQSTLDSYASAASMAGRSTSKVFAFKAKANPADADGVSSGPAVGSYQVGDFIDLYFARWNPNTGTGNPYLPNGGTYSQRIVGLSGDEQGDEISIQCAPTIG